MFAINTGNLSIFLVPLCSLKFYLIYLRRWFGSATPGSRRKDLYFRGVFGGHKALFPESFPNCEETWDLSAVFTAIQQPDRSRMKEHRDAANQICCCSHPEHGRFSSKVLCNTLQKCSLENITAAVPTVEGPSLPSPVKVCLWTPPLTLLHPKNHPLTPTFCFPNLQHFSVHQKTCISIAQ